VLVARSLDRLLGFVRDGQHADARLAFIARLERDDNLAPPLEQRA